MTKKQAVASFKDATPILEEPPGKNVSDRSAIGNRVEEIRTRRRIEINLKANKASLKKCTIHFAFS